nr:NADH dehydrogenase [ubiquinone] 1 beta subcomplex subunit 11, mitochondrial [Nomia melanderi]
MPTKATNTTDVPYEKKPWVSYGFHYEDKFEDRIRMHQTMFVLVSVLFVTLSVVTVYWPDPQLHDWAKREAYLQLRYREENGLPLVDPNLIDPSKVVLPSEEELSDVELII